MKVLLRCDIGLWRHKRKCRSPALFKPQRSAEFQPAMLQWLIKEVTQRRAERSPESERDPKQQDA
jgi:hypothetical protein